MPQSGRRANSGKNSSGVTGSGASSRSALPPSLLPQPPKVTHSGCPRHPASERSERADAPEVSACDQGENSSGVAGSGASGRLTPPSCPSHPSHSGSDGKAAPGTRRSADASLLPQPPISKGHRTGSCPSHPPVSRRISFRCCPRHSAPRASEISYLIFPGTIEMTYIKADNCPSAYTYHQVVFEFNLLTVAVHRPLIPHHLWHTHELKISHPFPRHCLSIPQIVNAPTVQHSDAATFSIERRNTRH